MSPANPTSVDPLVPLSLLEAVREADRPDGDGEAEYAPEFLNKRLGTTDTIYAQIRRYNEAVKRGHPIPEAEVVALARLMGRRPDAIELFRSAGVTIARAAYGRLSALMRGSVNVLPRIIARPIARRQAQKLLARYFGASSTGQDRYFGWMFLRARPCRRVPTSLVASTTTRRSMSC